MGRLVRRFVIWILRRNVRRVFLVMYDGNLVITRAYETQSGWMARYTSLPNRWSLLLPEGKTEGTNLVKGWKPYSGWTFLESVFMCRSYSEFSTEASK